MDASQLTKMSPFGVPELVSPSVIEPAAYGHDGVKRLAAEHERERKRVGALPVGTRIGFRRPQERRRTGTVEGMSADFCYRVRPDDGESDPYLGTESVPVLWASHGVEILGADGEVVSGPQRRGQRVRSKRTCKYSEEYRRTWVCRVDAHVVAGERTEAAVRMANEDLGCKHFTSSYHKWHRDLGLPKPVFAMGYSERHWREYCQAVNGGVAEGLSVMAAVRAANERLGLSHHTSDYYRHRKALGLVPEISTLALQMRARGGDGVDGVDRVNAVNTPSAGSGPAAVEQDKDADNG